MWVMRVTADGARELRKQDTDEEFSMATTMKPSPRKFQETASAILRQVAPLLTKARSMSFKKLLLMPQEEVDRSNQQTELLKWQQDMFHKILNTMCLVQDGLLDTSELVELRQQIIQALVALHPDGEWADYTRDKLLFLQDLHQARCISDLDYNAAKLPLLERLAGQGSHLGMQDFKLIQNSSERERETASSRIPVSANSSASTQPRQEAVEPQEASATAASTSAPDSESAKKKTPIKHVMDAVSRITNSATRRNLFFEDKQADEEIEKQPRVPHALDFVRTPGCPTREPPVTPGQQIIHGEGPFESPLFKDSSEGLAARNVFPEFRSDTTDLLPHLSNLSVERDESPSPSPGPATQPKPTLARAKSLTPSKLSFTPRSAPTPTKSPLGMTNSTSSKLSSSVSPGAKQDRSVSRKWSGLLRWQKLEVDMQADMDSGDKPSEEADQHPIAKKNMWQRLDVHGRNDRTSVTGATDDDGYGKYVSDKDPLIAAIKNYPPEKISPAYIHGEGPNVQKLKKKVSVRAAPTNFFIDQVLGDNIKSELDRIRVEMARTNPGCQTFTNDQIDAIATRLPVDKSELMRFSSKPWCDRYGDVVLEVVHQQFKSHVTEMDGLRTASKDRRKSRMNPTDAENDENRKSAESGQTVATQSAGGNTADKTHSPKLKKSPRVKSTKAAKTHTTTTRVVYTTEGNLSKEPSEYDHRLPESFARSPSSDMRPRRAVGYEDLDAKLGAEILRMPFRNFNESTRF